MNAAQCDLSYGVPGGGTSDVRILGPLEVWDGAREVPIGGGRQRALFAILLLRANEVVSADTLIDELWGDAPPPTAGKALQGLVSQLRRALDGGLEIITRAPGYVLRVESDALDVNRLERFIAQGRNALADGDPAAAAVSLRQALGLWRGPPLAEFAFDGFAQTEIRRLEELRLTATEERIEADLALGEHASLVEELEKRVAENPLRERLRGQLMLALYRAGRQADALDVYRQGRRALVDELGIEPGQALQALERGILSHDPALDAPPRPSPAPKPSERQERPHRPRWTRVVLVGLVLSLVAVAATLAPLLLTGGGGAVAVVPNSVVRIDPESNTVVEVVPVGTWPDRVAVAGDYVFVVSIESDTVSRVDTTTGEVSTFGNLIHPLGVAAEDARTVWFGSRSSKDVVRIDAESLAVERRLPLPGSSSSFLAVGAGSLWVVHSAISPPRGDQREPTSRVSLATGRLEAEFDTGSAPLFVAYGLGAAWVLNFGDSTVSRIDPEDGSMLNFPVGHLASALAVGFRSVWVGSDDQDSVWRLHPATGRTQAIIPVGGWPWEIATGADAVWVTNSADGTVSRIDPESNRVVATIRTGYAPHGVAVAPDGVWVAVARDNPSVPGADSTG